MHNPKGCWKECVAATLALFCATGLNVNAFSVYIPYLKELLELTHIQSSNFITVRSLFALGSIFIIKFYYEKLEVRFGFTLAIVFAAASAVLYSFARSFEGLCIAAAVSGLAYGLGGMYPAAILIHRWFPNHEGLAMGICAAGTGFAITVGAPVLTALTENLGLHTALRLEAGFILLCAIAAFFLIRNYPAGALHPHIARHAKQQPIRINAMFIAVVFIGVLGVTGFASISIHYSTEGYDAYRVSLIISAVGLALTIGKFMMGEVLDLWGAIKTNWLFFSMAILGAILFTFGNTIGFIPSVIAACLFGAGDSVATVGLTAYAKDLSTLEDYAATQQQYQLGFKLGGLLSGSVPGLIANYTGTYRGFYLLVAVVTVISTVVIQRSYLRRSKEHVVS